MVEYLPVYARLWVKSPVPKEGEGRKERRKEGKQILHFFSQEIMQTFK
jgi:hypothetical protein